MNQNTNEVNSKHKDRLFRIIFGEREALLSLYNAINGTEYPDSTDFEFNTLDDAIYMTMKNDISFIIQDEMDLYEHQSTWTPNMPYRQMQYTATLYKGIVDKKDYDVYSSKKIMLPTPIAIVFYNGTKNEPDHLVLKLSDLYEKQVDHYSLEFETIVLNINYGHNKDLMEKCEWLRGYAILIHKIRSYQSKGWTLTKAVNKSIDECIEEHILEDLLRKRRGEILDAVLTEYNEKKHLENEKQSSFDEGMKLGETRGSLKTLIELVQDGLLSISDAAKKANLSEEQFIEVLNSYKIS